MTCTRAVVSLCLLVGAPAWAQDLDRDGLPESLEQVLLDRFVPTLVLDAAECDGAPAAFKPGAVDPVVVARDGTLYGHVAARATGDGGGIEVEIKYFHLWDRDCGRPSHKLDVEHVSGLLWAPALDAPIAAWQARYWYAAAHEGTICDASSGAAAVALRAVTVGPYVYVSRGKHASYLERGHCKWGCGSDICRDGMPAPRAGVINLGEPGRPLNGATWTDSRRWSLASKLGSDFEPALRERLDRADPLDVVALRIGLRPIQSPILGGDTGFDALILAGTAAADALEASADAGATAVEATGRAVGTALRKTASGIARFLRLR
jgi:hypothetical protein